MNLFFSSNLIQLLATFLLGGMGYYIFVGLFRDSIRSKVTREIIAVKDFFASFAIWVALLYIAGSTIICFTLIIGETYKYSMWYQRSFAYFGDGFPIVMILFLAYGFFEKSKWMILISLLTMILMGGKVALVLAMVCLLVLSRKSEASFSFSQVFKMLVVAIMGYFILVAVSNSLNSPKRTANWLGTEHEKQTRELLILGEGACESLTGCLETQFFRPAKLRLATSTAGLWMTLQNGFPGDQYPGTREKFSKFMMKHNPWGINEKFNMSMRDWEDAGAIENPYLQIGSAYGPLGFGLTIGFFFYTSLIGYRNVVCGLDQSRWNAFTVFFIVLVLGNQSQEWIQRWSVVVLCAGAAIAHIWRIQISRAE